MYVNVNVRENALQGDGRWCKVRGRRVACAEGDAPFARAPNMLLFFDL